jgi:hypothetical protein
MGEHARWLIGTLFDAAGLAIFRRVTHPSASSKSSRSDSTFQVSLLAGDWELTRLKSAPARIPGTSAMFSTQAKSHCRRRISRRLMISGQATLPGESVTTSGTPASLLRDTDHSARVLGHDDHIWSPFLTLK